ncbi:MAG TPA: hypothetical protein VEK73_19300, partial [Xanthobacteraceae bacterium]|nr:hypothetical protein [Xanthobacteraceae bacterium]
AAFPGTKFEKLALVRTAGRRGLLAWDKVRNRYELTPAGWSELSPKRRFGLASLMVSTAVGAAIGAAALAFLWLPAGGSLRFVRAPVAASVAHNLAAPGSAAPSAAAPDSRLGAPDGSIEPAKAAELPAAEQPASEAVPTDVKPAKKPRHRTARRKKEPTNPAWAFGNAGFGSRGSAYR